MAILVVAGKIAIDRINAPHEGVIVTGTSASAAPGKQTSLETAQGTYASFKYPADMTQEPNSKLVTPVVEQFNFGKRDIESWNLAIGVLSIPGGSLMANNSYQFRKTEPNKYKESHMNINGQSVDVMTDTSVGGFSKVAFLVHGNYQATISLYGDDPAGVRTLSNAFHAVLSTWQWRQ